MFSVIIDNDSLTHLAAIDSKQPLINGLRLLFNSIHIPDEILNEFETHHHRNPERKKIITQSYQPNNFFRKCSSFETISKAFLQTTKGIDVGEAAAAAQYYKINARFIISEDIKFAKNLSQIYPGIRVIKMKHLLSMLDIHGLINWNECVSILHSRRQITSKELREAYTYVCNFYGVQIDKKSLSKKCSLKQLGIK